MNGSAGKPAQVSLEELIAICEEMAALVRADVPLERGLALFAEETPGGLGKLAQRLAERLGNGESLAAAFSDESQPLPEVYRAVVEAGLRSGRLAEALAGVARFARRVADLRSILAMAAIYPIVVLLVAAGIYRFFSQKVLSGVGDFQRIGWKGESPWQGMFGSQVAAVASVACLSVVLAMFIWWSLTQRESVWTRGGRSWLVGWLPFVGRAIRYGRLARFAELLAILVEQDVPLATALRLAGQGSGDARIAADGNQLAVALEQGHLAKSNSAHSLGTASLPPLVLWLIRARQPQPALVVGVRQLANTYVATAADAVAQARVFVPILLTVLFAGVAVFWLAFSIFAPWSKLLQELALPV